jgi:hypothetical protein
VNQIKVLAVVLRVTAHAIFAIGILHLHSKVVAMLVGECLRDFLMTSEALEGRRAGTENMAGIALGRSAKGRMGFRKGTRGNLCR